MQNRKARPILMSTPMVKAVLGGGKIQSRRIVKNADGLPARPEEYEHNGWAFLKTYLGGGIAHPFKSPYGGPGDLLWVREKFSWMVEWSAGTPKPGDRMVPLNKSEPFIWYAADKTYPELTKWEPSIFMPRAISRITLEITEIRVERLQAISVEDCIAEGCSTKLREHEAIQFLLGQYEGIWEGINGQGSWALNPWVWVISFRVHNENIDNFLTAKPRKEDHENVE